MTTMWKNKYKISTEAKLKLYKAYIETILTYNLATCPLTKTLENNLDSHHRKQLRRLLDIHYPEHISNVQLCQLTGTERISIAIQRHRLKLFQRIVQLRKDDQPQDPANKIMDIYLDIISEYKITCRRTHKTILDTLRNMRPNQSETKYPKIM
jgi:hypothetical protein